MKVGNQPKLMFQGVDFINLHLESFQQYDSATEIDLNIEPKVFYPEDDRTVFKIFMEVLISCDKFFNLSVVGIGNFQFDKEFDDEKLKKSFVNTNAPAIMFPYVRSFISTLTCNLGNVTGTLTIPTQFFQGDLKEFKEENTK